MVDAGIYKRSPRGDYSLDVIREVSFKRLRDELRVRGESAAGLTTERTRFAKATANIAERKDQAAAGKLIDVDKLVVLHNVERSVVREKLLSLSGELHRQMQRHRALQKYIGTDASL